jgi:hypothetical protein
MRASLAVPPVGEPLMLAEAKLHLRVDLNDDDALITALISAARGQVEFLTGQRLMTQTWELELAAGECAVLEGLLPIQSLASDAPYTLDGHWPPTLITYWFMALYCAAKTATFAAGVGAGAGWGDAILHAWTDADQALWAGVLNFWFLGRVFDRVRS